MNTFSPRTRAHALALTTALMWSFAFVCIRDVVGQLGRAGATAMEAMLVLFLARISVAGLCYVPHLAAHHRWLGRLRQRDWWLLGAMMLVGTYGYHMPLNYGAQFIPSGFVSLIIATGPVFAAVLAWLLLRERLGTARVAGVAMGLGGIVLCLLGQGRLRIESGAFAWSLLLAPASVFISAFTGALFSITGRALRRDMPKGAALSVAMVGATIIGLPLWSERAFYLLGQLNLRGWLALLYLAVCCIYLASICWMKALQELDAVEVIIYLDCTTALALLWGALLFHERPTWLFLAGAGCIVSGVFLVNRPRFRPEMMVEG